MLGLDLLKYCQVGHRNIYRLYHSDEMIDSMLWNKNPKMMLIISEYILGILMNGFQEHSHFPSSTSTTLPVTLVSTHFGWR